MRRAALQVQHDDRAVLDDRAALAAEPLEGEQLRERQPPQPEGADPTAPKVHVVTFGCQMNKYDSTLAEGRFRSEGYVTTPSMDDADVILFIGTRLSEITTGGYVIPGPVTHWIHVDVQPRVAHAGLEAPTLSVAADASRFLDSAWSDLRAAALDNEMRGRREGQSEAGGTPGRDLAGAAGRRRPWLRRLERRAPAGRRAAARDPPG